jgi:hypothetical protein
MDPNSVPEKIMVPQTTNAKYHTTYYDKKNALWRQPVDTELIQKADTMNNVNVDPWVYEFSSDVMKDIKHANARPGEGLSQVNKSDIKTSSYIGEDVNMFTRP